MLLPFVPKVPTVPKVPITADEGVVAAVVEDEIVLVALDLASNVSL